MTSLAEAKAVLAAQGAVSIPDIAPTEDEALNVIRQAAVNRLERQLRPEESMRLAAGEPLGEDDGLIIARAKTPTPPSDLTPNEQFAAAQNGC